MTFPGAETMKGGIMGDDCFLSSAGPRLDVDGVMEGIAEANCAGMESVGECSGVCIKCDNVLRGWRLPAVGLAIILIVLYKQCQSPHLARRTSSCAHCRW
jgi:hypothetical protein